MNGCQQINYPLYSVLMAVYALADPDHFDRALESMFTQTLPPDEFVLVCDGPLTDRLDEIIAGNVPGALCRVLNINTGSLAVEAGIKMMLARFYRQEPSSPTPKYAGKTPVFLVMQV